MYIDTHCHLNFKAFKDDYFDVYQRARDEHVEKMIVVGTSLDSNTRAIELAEELDGCFATVGVHPHHLQEFEELGQSFLKEKLIEQIKNKKVVAIGETGIDYYTYKDRPSTSEEEKNQQKELLQLHTELARQFELPLILHCRDAMQDMLEFFKRDNEKYEAVFHCFSGTVEELHSILDRGFYVGFDGNSTYKANQYLRDAISASPLERILIETDSPYLTPEPHRGGRSEPSYVTLVAECVAQVKNVSVRVVEEQTTLNASTLFQL